MRVRGLAVVSFGLVAVWITKGKLTIKATLA